MQETQALNLLDIPRSTFKEWSNPAHKKHKLYLLLKQIDVQYAQSCIVQKVPTHIMVTLNRNIKQEERFSDNEIFKLFSKKSYAKLTSREKVAFAKIVVRAHPIWPPCALALGQLTHEYLARLRIDYVASQESVMRS